MTTPRPDLTRYVVPVGELEYPEYAYRIRAADNTGRKHLHQLISALLNTSGGVIEIDPGLSLDSKQFDQWQDRLKDQLLKFMPQDIYHQCIMLCEEKCEEKNKLFMLVKKSTIFITTESYMHTRGAAPTTNHVSHWCDISALISQEVVKGISTIFPQNILYTYDDMCMVTESKCLEFKSYVCGTVDKLIENLRHPRTLKSLLGMANVRGGGEIILGIKAHPSGKGYVVVGQELDVSEEADFKQKLARLFTEDVNGTKRIWGDPSVVPSEGNHWACDILHLGSPPYRCQLTCDWCPHMKRRCLICIQIAQVDGDVYEKTPESFTITDDGDVHMYEFNEWQERHRSRKPSVSHLESLRLEKAITSTTKPAAAHISNSTGATEQYSDIFEDNMQISFREHSSYVELHRFTPEYSDHLLRKSKMFDMTQPLHCTPPAEDIERLANATIMNKVKTVLRNKEGFGIANTCLYNCIRHDQKTPKPVDHILDLLTFTTTAKVTLFIICSCFSKQNKRILTEYGMILGRLLKHKVLQNLSSNDKYPSLDLCCLFLDSRNSECHKVSPTFYDKHLQNTCELAGIISALGRVLTKVQTRFRDDVLVAAATSFSEEQMSTLLAIGKNRLNLIEGAPGCDKTLLAKHICETRGKANSVYISASRALNNRVQASGHVEVCLARDSDDIVPLLCGELKRKTHIVIDDNHCYRHNDQTLAELCRQIITTDKYLYVFQDSKFQNYQHRESSKFLSYLVSNDYSDYQVNTMTEIQRNSQIVGSFLKAQVKNLHHYDNFRCVSDVEGNDIQIKHVTKLRAHSKDNGLLGHIRDLISQPFSPDQWQCSYRDIAVLVDDSQGPEEVAMFKKVFQEFESRSNVQGAEVYPVQGTIVDLVKNFGGLESKVIVFIMSQSSPMSEQDDQSRLTKHMIAVASRGIHRVDILREDNLDKELANRMKIDLYPVDKLKQANYANRGPVCVWRSDEWKTVLDACWVREGQHSALLYITRGSVRRVSESGKAFTLSLDTSHMTLPWSLTSSHDGEWAVVADDVSPGSWTAYRRLTPEVYQRHVTYPVDGKPLSVRVTPQGYLAMLVMKGHQYYLRLYKGLSDPDLVWEQPIQVLAPVRGALSLSVSGTILVGERRGVTQFNVTDGTRITNINYPAGLNHATAMCADSSGRVWVGCMDGSVWLCGQKEGYTVIKTRGMEVWSLSLLGHHLAVVTYDEGLQLYDMRGPLTSLSESPA